MNVSAAINVGYSVTENLTYGLAAAAQVKNEGSASYTLVNGTAAGQIDLHFEKKAVTLAAGASVTYTLSALTDDLGRTVALVKVKTLTINPTTRASGDSLVVGNAGVHPWGGFVGGTAQTYTVYDVDQKVCSEGVAVTSGTADQLKITNAGSASVTFNLQISGTSV